MDRRERAERILDVAAGLLLRWGYQKVTVDDVAERAGIGKGTVYLHWKSRQDLFRAVFRRELAAAADELVAAIRADPRTVLLHELTRVNFESVAGRPLLRAHVRADPAVLGKLARDRAESRHDEAFADYLWLLAEHDLVRTDLPFDDLRYAWHATLEGFFLSPPHPGAADLLAATVRGAFEPAAEPDPAVLAELAPRVADLFTEIGNQHRAAYEGGKP
ncbi:TetR/AcrR family transcriptional regulator [Amycolatopsis thermalba]|uniref:TetR/AcrR family transcriptional regulator n=1 Tax=Amycolatopsis thermalba TaxID=944492 RepID=A0ABY4P5M4_9PSEU|nr:MULTISPECIES: TetR/AcrR family transcriptional regulator [Amycolatopsis]UQS27542.1 TetR/AcrR family transcriptional regulator [Amycolatopsis thermalba]